VVGPRGDTGRAQDASVVIPWLTTLCLHSADWGSRLVVFLIKTRFQTRTARHKPAHYSPPTPYGEIPMKTMFALLIVTMITMIAPAQAELLDPGVTPTRAFTCTAPTTRTDGAALPVAELAEIRLLVSTNNGKKFSAAKSGITPTKCRTVIDYSKKTADRYRHRRAALEAE